jgi:hypothetical protein
MSIQRRKRCGNSTKKEKADLGEGDILVVVVWNSSGSFFASVRLMFAPTTACFVQLQSVNNEDNQKKRVYAINSATNLFHHVLGAVYFVGFSIVRLSGVQIHTLVAKVSARRQKRHTDER